MPCDMSALPLLIGANGLENETRSVGPVGKRKIRRRRSVVVPTASALRRTSNLLLGRAGIGGLSFGCAGICLLGDRRQRRGCKHAADRSDRSKRLERFLEGSHGG